MSRSRRAAFPPSHPTSAPAVTCAGPLRALAVAFALIVTLAGPCLQHAAAAASASAPLEGADQALFPVPESLHPATDFWRRVYTEVTTTQGFVHDNRHLGVVYETIDLGDRLSYRQRSRVAQRRITHYRRILEKLATGRRQGLSAEETRVLELWPADVSDATLAQAAGRLRFQLGQADRFRAGIERAGRYLPYIRAELARAGLPAELAYLPHVESSFTPGARSHAAAVGMWQFTRPTGRRFMRIDHVVDERLDPYLASSAAVRLLRANYQDLGAWPLALTAYNHGVAGMASAVRQLGTSDIGEIVERYDGRTFGFASRNFYASFIAAVHVHEFADQYFDDISPEPPQHQAFVEIPDFVPAAVVAKALGVELDRLEALNPALRWPVWQGEKHLPRGYRLRLPAEVDPVRAAAALEDGVPAQQRFAQQTPDVQHRVSQGETLSLIAARYGVSTRAIAELNGLRSAHFIRIGQTLKLPARADASSAPPVVAQMAATGAPPSAGAANKADAATARHRSAPKAVVASAAPPADAGDETVAAATAPMATGGTYEVRRGDTLSVIARRLGVDMQDLIAANRLQNAHRLRIGQTLLVPGDGDSFEPFVPELYTVQRGDSVWEVAARFDLERDQVMALNDLRAGQHIYIGQELRLLPASGSAASSTSE